MTYKSALMYKFTPFSPSTIFSQGCGDVSVDGCRLGSLLVRAPYFDIFGPLVDACREPVWPARSMHAIDSVLLILY